MYEGEWVKMMSKKVWKNFKIKITFTNFTGIVSDFKKRS